MTDVDFLFVPHLQHVPCAHDATGHDSVSAGESAKSEKAETSDREEYVPVNYISPEVYALLAAAEASAARRAQNLHAASADICNIEADGQGLEPCLAAMAPPRRFYTTFWRSITLRLLDHWAHSASTSSRPLKATLITRPQVA